MDLIGNSQVIAAAKNEFILHEKRRPLPAIFEYQTFAFDFKRKAAVLLTYFTPKLRTSG
jgi:hypothetical protein